MTFTSGKGISKRMFNLYIDKSVELNMEVNAIVLTLRKDQPLRIV